MIFSSHNAHLGQRESTRCFNYICLLCSTFHGKSYEIGEKNYCGKNNENEIEIWVSRGLTTSRQSRRSRSWEARVTRSERSRDRMKGGFLHLRAWQQSSEGPRNGARDRELARGSLVSTGSDRSATFGRLETLPAHRFCHLTILAIFLLANRNWKKKCSKKWFEKKSKYWLFTEMILNNWIWVDFK